MNEEEINSDDKDLKSKKCKKSIRVRFGNPALGTYSGSVWIEKTKLGTPSTINEEKESNPEPFVSSCLSAMVHVPPEQVPEGILTLARAHRQNISHVRIVISQNESPLAAARLDRDDGKAALCYLVLFELQTPEAAELFVQDLNGRSYTSLVPDDTCNVYHVIKVEGDDGIEVMSPFFAASLSKVGSSDSKDKTELTSVSRDLSNDAGASTTIDSPGSTPNPQRDRTFSVASEGANSASTSPWKIVSTSDVQNCAVCLEPMDTMQLLQKSHSPNQSKVSAFHEPILTTVCNHSFHLNCLLKWQDSPCPVCRYDHSGLNNETLSECHVCGTTENSHVCLICGVVSCGGNLGGTLCNTITQPFGIPQESCERLQNDNSGHARLHYEQTLHAYALETETQHVWDFAGGGYVHRLIRNSDDGKLVEITDPLNTSSNERSTQPGYLSDTKEGEVVHRKLEGFATQYYTLLKSQLEQQRIYYEGRLSEIKREGKNKKPNEINSTASYIVALKQERRQLEQRQVTLQRKHQKVADDLVFLKSMTESLEQNKALMDREIEAAKRERNEAQEVLQQLLPPLEMKVALLMQQLDAVDMRLDDRKPAAS